MGCLETHPFVQPLSFRSVPSTIIYQIQRKTTIKQKNHAKYDLLPVMFWWVIGQQLLTHTLRLFCSSSVAFGLLSRCSGCPTHSSLCSPWFCAYACPIQPPLLSHFAVVTCPSSGVSGFAIVVYITIPCGFILYETRYEVPLAPASAALAHVCFCWWIHTLRSSHFILLGI